MTITTITVDPNDDRMEQGPYLRMEMRGDCGLPGCNCSPDPFVLISNGTTALSVTLTPEQLTSFLASGRLMAQ